MVKKIKNIAALTGIAAGAGYLVGILTAPKSGRKTRSDIKKTASKAKTEGEKKLKKLHSELREAIDAVTKKKDRASSKASKEMKDAIKTANQAKEKARQLLSALHDGDADDPNLKAVIKEVSDAKADLEKFLKK
jgi:gas vesicle protein